LPDDLSGLVDILPQLLHLLSEFDRTSEDQVRLLAQAKRLEP
jgi:hypothetical protein